MIGAFFCFFIGTAAAFVLGSAVRDRAQFGSRRVVKVMAKVIAVERYTDEGEVRYRHCHEFRREDGMIHCGATDGHWKAAAIGDEVELGYPEGFPELATMHFEAGQTVKLYGSAIALAVCLAYAPFANWRELFFFLN